MLRAVEDAHVGLVDVEAGRAASAWDKTASHLKGAIEKLRGSGQDLMEAAVKMVTAREVAWPVFEDVDLTSPDAAAHHQRKRNGPHKRPHWPRRGRVGDDARHPTDDRVQVRLIIAGSLQLDHVDPGHLCVGRCHAAA